MIKPTNIESIEKATSQSWNDWLTYFDKIKAHNLSHKEIAAKVLPELEGKVKSPAWWAQSVTVAYEQHIGRRIPGQTSDGKFHTSLSKSTPLSMTDLMESWVKFTQNDKRMRDLNLQNIRTSGTTNRLNWRAKSAAGSSITVSSEPKSGKTASLVIQVTGQPTQDANLLVRKLWSDILSKFIESLNSTH